VKSRSLLELASRIGYVARGAVYLSVGAIALLAALDKTPKATGAVGALEAWADWPAGRVLILLVAWGLVAFAVWRGLQSLLDADGQGTKPKGLAVRAGQAISGVVHAALAMSVFELADGLEDVNEEDEARETAGQVLDLPMGEWLLLGAGAFILALGVVNILQAFKMDVGKRLHCPGEARPWVSALGKIGSFGRGVAFVPLGWFIGRAGLEARASEAHGMGGVLQMLERQPFGSWVLALTALGLIAYGLFALVEARYRRMNVPRLAS